MRPKRILLLHISKVSGHKQATIAIENAIKELAPSAEVMNINAFNYTNPISEKIINGLYLGVLKRAPAVWDYLYDNPRIVKAATRFKNRIHTHNSPKLKRLYDSFKPDVIVCSQAFPCGMVSDFKNAYNINVPLVAVLTDYVPHSFWLYDNVNYYICPDSETKQKLIAKGISEKKIKIYGIPIDPKFNKLGNREAICSKLGLDIRKPKALIMGGGHGLGPIKTIVRSIDRIKIDLDMLVVCGVNKKLLKWLFRKSKRAKKKILPFGFVDNIEQLMSISNVILTKPGGITTAEALAMNLPMIIVNPLPGQEYHNTQFLLKLGTAVLVDKPRETGKALESLLNHPNELTRLKETIKKIATPNSSLDIARLLLSL